MSGGNRKHASGDQTTMRALSSNRKFIGKLPNHKARTRFENLNTRSIGTRRAATTRAHHQKIIKLFIFLLATWATIFVQSSSAADSDEDQFATTATTSKQQSPIGQEVGGLVATRRAHFSEPENNNQIQRIAVGRSVRFKCGVNDIGKHTIAWFHKDRRLLLAIDNKTVAWSERIQVSSQANKVFFLQIDSVQLADKGQYMCQLNTQPPQSQVHILDVVKSPKIREKDTTMNVQPVKEFQSVELRCVADGIPKPVIKWRRESQLLELARQRWSEVLSVDGSAAELETTTSKLVEPNDEQPADAKADNSTGARLEAPAGRARRTPSGEPAGLVATMTAGGASRRKDHLRNEEPQGSSRRSHKVSLSPPEQNPHDDLVDATSDDDKRAAPAGKWSEPPSRQQNQRRQWRRATDQERQDHQQQATPTGGANHTRDSFIGEGEVLRLERVSRYDMGFYMCIASNGVPPKVSQRIFLPVSYLPTADATEEAQERKTAADPKAADPNGFGPDATLSHEHQSSQRTTRIQPAGGERQQVVKTTIGGSSSVGGGQTKSRYRKYQAPRSSTASSASSSSLGLASKAPVWWLALHTGLIWIVTNLLFARPNGNAHQ